MRRMFLLTAAVAAIAAVTPAYADEGMEAGAYYEIVVAGQPVAEFPGNVRVFTECADLHEGVCGVLAAVPRQDLGVFAGDTSVDVSVRTNGATYP